MVTRHVVDDIYEDPIDAFPTAFVVEHICPSCGKISIKMEPFRFSPNDWEEAGMDGNNFNITKIEQLPSSLCDACQRKATVQAYIHPDWNDPSSEGVMPISHPWMPMPHRPLNLGFGRGWGYFFLAMSSTTTRLAHQGTLYGVGGEIA